MAKALSNRENPSLANLDDKYVFILGGTVRIKCTTDYYNVASNAWTSGPRMTETQHKFSTCFLDRILYAFNGARFNKDFIESLDAQSLIDG